MRIERAADIHPAVRGGSIHPGVSERIAFISSGGPVAAPDRTTGVPLARRRSAVGMPVAAGRYAVAGVGQLTDITVNISVAVALGIRNINTAGKVRHLVQVRISAGIHVDKALAGALKRRIRRIAGIVAKFHTVIITAFCRQAALLIAAEPVIGAVFSIAVRGMGV